jgi:hypothetical protein
LIDLMMFVYTVSSKSKYALCEDCNRAFTLSHNKRGVSFSPRFLAIDSIMADALKVVG